MESINYLYLALAQRVPPEVFEQIAGAPHNSASQRPETASTSKRGATWTRSLRTH